MFLIRLLWLTIVAGGFYLAAGYAVQIYRGGFETAHLLNVIVFGGSALFGLPKLIKLFVKK